MEVANSSRVKIACVMQGKARNMFPIRFADIAALVALFAVSAKVPIVPKSRIIGTKRKSLIYMK